MIHKQFEIYYVQLNPTKGSEQAGMRPCIILQTNAVADIGKTTLIAPLTSRKLDKVYPYEVLLTQEDIPNLGSNSKVKLDQIRVIDKTRIHSKLGVLKNRNKIQEIIFAIDILLDKPGNFR